MLHNKLTLFKRICLLFILIFLGSQICHSQSDTYEKQKKDALNQSYKELYHTLNSFTIESVAGKEIFRWKKLHSLVAGLVKFQCDNRMDTGERNGIEGNIYFKKGLKHGLEKVRNCQTGTCYEINYSDGLMDGHCKVYFKSAKYVKGERIEIDTTFNETNFIKGSGMWKDFYADGKLKETGEYKSGKKEGEWSYYEDREFLYLKKYYKEGVLVDSVKIEIPQAEILEIRKSE